MWVIDDSLQMLLSSSPSGGVAHKCTHQAKSGFWEEQDRTHTLEHKKQLCVHHMSAQVSSEDQTILMERATKVGEGGWAFLPANRYTSWIYYELFALVINPRVMDEPSNCRGECLWSLNQDLHDRRNPTHFRIFQVCSLVGEVATEMVIFGNYYTCTMETSIYSFVIFSKNPPQHGLWAA